MNYNLSIFSVSSKTLHKIENNFINKINTTKILESFNIISKTSNNKCSNTYNNIKYFEEVGEIILNNDKSLLEENITTLREISLLEEGWDGYDARKINEKVIKKLEQILPSLFEQPDIFPLVNGNIQFEYEKENGEYLEFETLNDKKIKIFTLDSQENEDTKFISFDLEEILNEVKTFYGIKQ